MTGPSTRLTPPSSRAEEATNQKVGSPNPYGTAGPSRLVDLEQVVGMLNGLRSEISTQLDEAVSQVRAAAATPPEIGSADYLHRANIRRIEEAYLNGHEYVVITDPKLIEALRTILTHPREVSL